MTEHKIGTREEWLAARRELLAAEKEHTRRGDELARRRRELPWVPVDKEYGFDTEDGRKTLAELFDGRSQLLVYHFMFGPDYEAGCPSCSSIADGFNGFVVHLAHQRRDDALRLARAARQAPGLQRADGLDVPVGVVARTATSTTTSRPRSRRALREGGEYNFAPFGDTTVSAPDSARAETREHAGDEPGRSYLRRRPG